MKEDVKDTFDEWSPITGEFTVLVEDQFRLDLKTGYQNSKDLWTTDNEDAIKEIEDHLPSYMIPYKFVDEDTKNVWYPMFAVKHSAVLCPIPGDTDTTFHWSVCAVEKLVDKNDINTNAVINLPCMVNGKEEMVLFKVSNTPIQVFKQNEFEEAFTLYNETGHEFTT